MNISVFGLGYVGTVTAACFARDGHTVIGVDPNPAKTALIGEGRSPVIEVGVGELIADAVERGRLVTANEAAGAVAGTSVSFVCVGTPSQSNGSLETQYLERVCEEIGTAIGAKAERHVVVIRSTSLPGTTCDLVIPALEKASGKTAGEGFGVCFNPEFLREGTAVHDFDHPPKTVIGCTDGETSDVMRALYERLEAPLFDVDIAVAEMVKYCDNAWHALKIGFANEVGTIAKAVGIDSHAVMDIFVEDQKLNISKAYLKPGQAFGGSCLPKDLRALNYKARALDVETPILASILPSNQVHLERAIEMVTERDCREVGVLGFSFKAGTDDLRESPVVEMIERLLGKGYDLRIYDRNVNLAKLVGANRDYILNRIPHISKLMVDTIDEVIEHAGTLVIGNGDPEFRSAIERLHAGQGVIDLVRIAAEPRTQGAYDGICW